MDSVVGLNDSLTFCCLPSDTVLAVPFTTGLPLSINVKLAKVAAPPSMCLIRVTVGGLKVFVIVHCKLVPLTTLVALITPLVLQSPENDARYISEAGKDSVTFC